MNPLISVIVPVYKVEDVLVRCLDSLMRQSLSDIEIILVDDASPDRCGEICEEYARRDSRFKVFHHTENMGLSVARNTGIAQASAEYLMFADSDDYVHEDFCRLPYECAIQYQVDIVMFCAPRIDRIGKIKSLLNKKRNHSTGYKTKCEALEICGAGAWNKLYRKSLFDTIKFPEGYYYEDIGVIFKIILLADRFFYLDKELYYYCYRKGSIITLRTEKALKDFSEMSMQRYRGLAAYGYPADKLRNLLNEAALKYCIYKKADWEDPDYVFYLNTLLSENKVPQSLTRHQKVLFLLLKYCPPLFDAVCVLWGKR